MTTEQIVNTYRACFCVGCRGLMYSTGSHCDACAGIDPPQQWEYNTYYGPISKMYDFMRVVGEAGWEMVSSMDDDTGSGILTGKWIYIFFKRRKKMSLTKEEYSALSKEYYAQQRDAGSPVVPTSEAQK